MELTDNERRAVTDAALIDGNMLEVPGYGVRRMSLGSLMQLQKIGNPFCRLGEIDMKPDEAGNIPTMWEVMGIKDELMITYAKAEFLWVHMADMAEVRQALHMPAEERAGMVEKLMMGISIYDFPRLEAAVMSDVEASQAGMVQPGESREEDDDPLGRGRPGARPC